ncbi:MAG: type II toxin-antitoxin system PemK/MazF family toxin, partial [Candidatus Acidiferrales bacterium]
PQAGTEQAGRRPAIVLSPQRFNVGTGLLFACPITNQVKGSPFEVSVPHGIRLTGVVLTDHLRSLDWIARRAEFHGKAAPQLLDDVLGRIEAILF